MDGQNKTGGTAAPAPAPPTVGVGRLSMALYPGDRVRIEPDIELLVTERAGRNGIRVCFEAPRNRLIKRIPAQRERER